MIACANPACTVWTARVVDASSGSIGGSNSIALAPDGNPVISYLDSVNDLLKIATCADPTCSNATLTVVGTSYGFESDRTLAIEAGGNPVMSYRIASGVAVAVVGHRSWVPGVPGR